MNRLPRLLLSALLLLVLTGCGSERMPTSETFLIATQQAASTTASYSVLFDNFHAETAGNADWVISSSQPDPLRENANPQQERDWTGGISAWGVALQKTGRYTLKTNTSSLTYGIASNPLDLSRFNVLVLPEPNKLLSSGEKQAVIQFVQRGGGLFMVADHDRSDRNNDGADSLRVLNDLIANNGLVKNPFGITFDVLNLGSENPNNDAPAADPLLQGPFGSAKSSIIRNGTTETLDTTANPAARGVIFRSGFDNQGSKGAFVSRSSYGKGRIVAIGDSSAFDDGTCGGADICYNGWDDRAGSNAALFLNATEWLASSGGNQAGNPTALPPPTSLSPTVASGSIELLKNGGFEQGTSGWTAKEMQGGKLVDGQKPHAGSSSAHFCGYNNCTASLYQTISVPKGATSVSLRYYWLAQTTEQTHSYDFLYVRVRDRNGSPLVTLQTISDGNAAGDWQAASYDLSQYQGQTIQVAFAATNGARSPTSFYVDEVSVATR